MMYCKIIWLKSWIKVNLYFPSVEEPDVTKDIPEIEEGKFCHCQVWTSDHGEPLFALRSHHTHNVHAPIL